MKLAQFIRTHATNSTHMTVLAVYASQGVTPCGTYISYRFGDGSVLNIFLNGTSTIA